MTILLLSLAGVVLSIVVGTIWYSPGTPMGRVHMRYLGFSDLSTEEQKKLIEKAKPTMPKIYAGQMLLSLLTSGFTVFVVSMSVQNGVPLSMAIMFPILAWLCFTVPAVGGGILWSNTEGELAWKRFLSETLCTLVTILLIALMTSFFI
jgi:hypothetical protein